MDFRVFYKYDSVMPMFACEIGKRINKRDHWKIGPTLKKLFANPHPRAEGPHDLPV